LSPERLAEIRRELALVAAGEDLDVEWDRLLADVEWDRLLADVDRLKVEIIDWTLAKADSDREVDRLTAERDELLDERSRYYEAVSLSPERLAEIDRALEDPAALIYRTTARELRAEVDRLAGEREKWQDAYGVAASRADRATVERDRLAARVRRLEDALRIYAATETWGEDDWGVRSVNTKEYGDSGQIARKALDDSDQPPACPVCRADAMIPDGDGGWVCTAGCYYRSADEEEQK
jgi:hypothetical protein